MTGRTHVPGGVRAHLDRSPRQRLHQARLARRLGSIGQGAFLERGTEVLRYPRNVSIGAHAIVKSGARICPANAEARISIGEWSSVGYHTHIFATSTITIGANCLIAPFCYLVDADHGIQRDALIRLQPMAASPIAIGDDVWIGAGATILAGVTIADGAVVAAGSVVTSDIGTYEVWAGTPARQVRER